MQDHMKMMLDEMDKMQISSITEVNDLSQVGHGSRSERRSITRSLSHNIRPVGELNILPPLHAKTKGSGRPKGGGIPRIQSDREKRAKGKQCKTCGKHNVNHDSRNCPDKNIGLPNITLRYFIYIFLYCIYFESIQMFDTSFFNVTQCWR